MLDRDEYARWRTAADEAHRGAHVQSAAGLFSWACFLAEQAARLDVKGLLHGMGIGASGHDLVVLGRMVEDATAEPIPADVAAALRRLSRHYIPARYPHAHPSGSPGEHFGPDDAAHASADLDIVLAFVDATWRRLAALAGETGRAP